MANPAALYPNALRACIQQAGYSLREVSRETAIPESTLYDWAAGKRVIPHKQRQVLALLLGCAVELLAPNTRSALVSSDRDDSVDRRNLVKYSQEHLQSSRQLQQGFDMDRTRRLIVQAMTVAGMAFLGNVERLLDAEPWQKLLQATPSSIDRETLMSFNKLTEAC